MNLVSRVQKFLFSLLLFAKFAFAKKYGLVEITSKNYQSTVIDGERDAWILAVKNAGKVSLEEWKETELNLRGLSVRVGVIDPQKDGAFLKNKGFLQKDKTYPVARVFPYGGYKIKAVGKKDVKSRLKAEKVALDSLPDETTKITTMLELEKYARIGFLAKPLQMPVVLLTDKRTTSPLFRAVALKYSKFFNFGAIHKPSAEMRHNMNIQKLPAIIVIIAVPIPEKEMIRTSSIVYDAKAYGDLSYLNLTRFMAAVHKKHWNDHPEAKKYKEKVGLEEFFMEDAKEIIENGGQAQKETERKTQQVEITFENHKRMCTDSALGVCLVYFVDGGDKKQVKQALRLFKDLQKMPDNDDKPLHYLWVDAACHPEYGDIFGISPDNLPVLLLATPKQRLYKTMDGVVTMETVNHVVSNIFQGKEDLAYYSRFNDMLEVDCQRVSPPSSKNTQDKNDEKEEANKETKSTKSKTKKQKKSSSGRKTQKAEEL